MMRPAARCPDRGPGNHLAGRRCGPGRRV